MFKPLKRAFAAVLAGIFLLASSLVQAGACCSSFSIFPDTTRNFSSSSSECPAVIPPKIGSNATPRLALMVSDTNDTRPSAGFQLPL